MRWKKLQAEGKVRAHKTSKKELDELRAVIARDLEDAAIQRRPGSNGRNPQEEKEKNTLDSYRPAHGRHLAADNRPSGRYLGL